MSLPRQGRYNVASRFYRPSGATNPISHRFPGLMSWAKVLRPSGTEDQTPNTYDLTVALGLSIALMIALGLTQPVGKILDDVSYGNSGVMFDLLAATETRHGDSGVAAIVNGGE